MTAHEPGLARAITDADDRMIAADGPLALLQLQCGGELPGRIAIPALLEAVRKARRYQLKLSRNIHARNGEEEIAAWVEVEPRQDGDDGCDIKVGEWKTKPFAVPGEAEAQERRLIVERHVAELTAVLDGDQRLLAVESDAPDLGPVFAAMERGLGRPWTDFLEVSGLGDRQPVHWRLLDGASIAIPGSDRGWHVTLVPKGAGSGEPTGFDLLLVASEPLAPAPDMPVADAEQQHVIGQEIAPVLRQPIARIIANAETIRSRLAGPLDDQYAQYASDIANAGQLLLGLLDDLSDLEVIEAHDFKTAPDRIDLATVARQAAGILGVRANEKAIVIDAPRHGETLHAIAEFRRVLQILLNLIGNAIRYSPEDSQIWIRLEDCDGRARIIVADQGPGMSEEQAQVVFTKFERLGRSDDGGSGLGLYISRRLARAMGGELDVESAPGKGARFILDLPAAPDAD